ncbi:hypothetical protein SAMN02799632_00840 [Acinetobacter pittii]|uniref:hypothetical protein n=1 Tax=Acinetobacter pittii TaxID=48296 RepID=UPI00070AF372|nr:hypothetical protein [Acinetobacter pittii]KRJ56126.1 hypothetical protein APC88_08115 [Acinetobacter pittii]SEO61720.1 hypothetical protein SAMN02799632_00840 [Acinetobacter pittii]
MNTIISNIIALLGVGVISGVFLSLLKYVFFPQYRLELNRKKYSDDATIVLKYYNEIYKTNRTMPKSKFELQKATNAAFGTTRFNYELLFMLFDRDERDVEGVAKELQKRWILIKIDTTNKKIKSRLTVLQGNILGIIFSIIYFIFSIIVLVIMAGYYWLPLKNFHESHILIFSFLVIFICAYAFIVLGSIQSLERLVDRTESD